MSEEVLSIFNDRSAIAYLATVEDGKPRVRPWGFGFVSEVNGRLYFSTSSTKDVYKQLEAVPYVEYSKTNADKVWLRIRGEIKFDEDIKAKELFLEKAPALKARYETADNPVFKIFYLEKAQATVDDYSPNPRRVYEFANGVFTKK